MVLGVDDAACDSLSPDAVKGLHDRGKALSSVDNWESFDVFKHKDAGELCADIVNNVPYDESTSVSIVEPMSQPGD